MRAQMAYILAVNASIISQTGGPCSAADCTVRTARARRRAAVPLRERGARSPESPRRALQGPDKSDDCVWPDVNGITDPGYDACMVPPAGAPTQKPWAPACSPCTRWLVARSHLPPASPAWRPPASSAHAHGRSLGAAGERAAQPGNGDGGQLVPGVAADGLGRQPADRGRARHGPQRLLPHGRRRAWQRAGAPRAGARVPR